MNAISHHAALIYVMVIVSAADGEMTDAELHVMGELIRLLPVFADYEKEHLPATAEACAELLGDEDGLENALVMIKQALPARLKETAYAVACDVAGADGAVHQEELRLLEMIRHEVGIERLAAAAIERAARARSMAAAGAILRTGTMLYIIMSPGPPGGGGGGGGSFNSGSSAMPASVVTINPATEAAS